MTGRIAREDDDMLRRVRRTVALAKDAALHGASPTLCRALVADLHDEIAQLAAACGRIENELKALKQRVEAASAYNRCAGLRRASTSR